MKNLFFLSGLTCFLLAINTLSGRAQNDSNIQDEKIFIIVENRATPKRGMGAFYKYIRQNLKYPKRAFRQGIEGRVVVQCVVDTNGNLTNFEIKKSIGGGCDEEAIRLLKAAQQWEPASQRGKLVKYCMYVPITFRLKSVVPVIKEATPTNGKEALHKFIAKHLTYPKVSKQEKKTGKVYVRFQVSKEGILSNFEVSWRLGKAYDKEALRVAKLLPKWKPATNHGIPIASTATIKIHFKNQ